MVLRERGKGPSDPWAIPRRIARALDESARARRSVVALVAVLAYLLLGQLLTPGFTAYWGYHVVQAAIVLVVVLSLGVVFHDEGGLAWQTHLIIVTTVVGDTVGTANDYYHSFESYDKLVHFASGAAFAVTVYDVLTALHLRGVLRLSPAYRLLVSIAASFTVAGLAWEIYEALGDVVFSTDRVQSRMDTIHDLMSNICGAVLAGSVLWTRDTTVRGTGRATAPEERI